MMHPSLCKYIESFYTLHKPVASTIITLAGALYKVFCASADQARKEMLDACFNYLALGGVCSTGPVALLSGLNPRPLSLVLPFFAMDFYGVGRLLLPLPSSKRLWIGACLISGASAIIFPIIKTSILHSSSFEMKCRESEMRTMLLTKLSLSKEQTNFKCNCK